MVFRLLAGACILFCAAFFGHATQADALRGHQDFTRIAESCGGDKSQPSYTKAEYAAALRQAEKARRQAKAKDEKVRETGINKSVARIKECQKEEVNKWTVPEIGDCKKFLNDYKSFSASAAADRKKGKLKVSVYNVTLGIFRDAAKACVREIMTTCIDPRNTPEVDFVIEVFAAARELIPLPVMKGKSATDDKLIRNNLRFINVHFCTETDYACRGNRAACDRRIDKIKEVLDYWDLR